MRRAVDDLRSQEFRKSASPDRGDFTQTSAKLPPSALFVLPPELREPPSATAPTSRHPLRGPCAAATPIAPVPSCPPPSVDARRARFSEGPTIPRSHSPFPFPVPIPRSHSPFPFP